MGIGEVDLKRALPLYGGDWSNMNIASRGAYLGFIIGPGRVGRDWEGPIAKFEGRVEAWKDMGVGLHFSVVAYNTYALPTLNFTAQLATVSEQVVEAVGKGLRKLGGGPGQ